MNSSFNELDRWLLRHWKRASDLEAAMKDTRGRYEAVFERVVEQIQSEVPQLDLAKPHFGRDGGHIGLARKAWPSLYPTWPSGLWIWDIGLENLVCETGDDPTAGVLLRPSKRRKINLEKARRRLAVTGKRLAARKRVIWTDEETAYPFGWFPLPESRRKLLDMLLSEKGDRFVECVVGHFRLLVDFVGVLDDIYSRNG